MKSDFTFVLHCAKCGLNGEIEEYTLRYQCPECGSEMRLFRIDANISGESLRTRLRELLSAKARGDQISGRIFALLADSSDPEVRKLIDDVLEEKYCRDHGISTPRPTVKLEPEGATERGGGTGTVTTYTYSGPRASLTSVTIPEGVKTIGKKAFAGCENLTDVTIPEGVRTIGDGVFAGCRTVEVSSDNRNFYTDDSGALIDRTNGRLLYFPPRFSGAYTVPSSVKTIGELAFGWCTGLTSVTIPSSVTTIGMFAFEYCTGLTSVTIPPSVMTIYSGAFFGCPCEASVKKQFPKYR